jgi:glyoxylase-like metal-dependent hydrolase (beta-lactamase superfamily II)
MSLINDLGYGVYQIDALYTEPGIACLYCVVEQGEIAIIETGTTHSLPQVLQLIEQLQLSPDDVRYVVPTHVHLDHAGGAGRMMQTFPNARLVIHPRGARHMIDPTQLVTATRAVYGDDVFDRLYGEIPPIDENRVLAAADGFRFTLGERDFLVLDTPGHAFHHFCVFDRKSQGVFSGDTFGLSYPELLIDGSRFIIPTTTPSHFSPELLLESIDRIMALAPQRIYLTHFGELPAPQTHVEQYRRGIQAFVELTQSVKPGNDEAGISQLGMALGAWLQDQFKLDERLITGKLANDIRLNSQGLAHWYQRQKQD